MSQAEVQQTYARIVTNHTEMQDLLSRVRMKGTDIDGQTVDLVEDVILRFEDGQVHANVFDSLKSVWVDIHEDFEGIRREGTLVIGDISEFLSYLGRFGERTIVEQTIPEEGDTYHLLFSDEERKQGGYPATDEEHIESSQDVDQLPYQYDPETDDEPHAPTGNIFLDTWFKVNVSDIQDVLADGDTTDVRSYPISVNDGHLNVSVGDSSGYIRSEFDAEEGEGEAAAIFGYGMDNVWSNLEGTVMVFMDNDNPMWIHQETEDKTLDYMIADDDE